MPVRANAVLCALALAACEPLEAADPRVPSASDAQPGAEPGWVLSGGGRSAYVVRRDPEQLGAVLLEPAAETGGKYGTWMRHIDAGPYRGKRIKISAAVRTEGTTRRADFWARAQAVDSPADGKGLGGQWKKLPADSEWTPYSVFLDVADSAERVEYGVGIAGPGRLWVDQTTVEVVGDAAPSPATTTPESYPGEQRIGDWLETGSGAPDYAVSADGDSVRIEPRVATQRYVALVHVVEANAFAARRVTVSFDVKTQGISGGTCIVKVQRTPALQYSGFLASGTVSAPSLSPGFSRCDLSVDVPPDAAWILYGLTFRGQGRAWVRGGQIDGGPTTPQPPPITPGRSI